MYKTSIFRLLSLGFLFGVESLSPAVSSLGSIIKKRLDTGVYTPVFEADVVSEKEQACVLFFTGLNSIIPGEIYGDFLTNMAEQGITTYVAGADVEETGDLLEDLVERYANVTVVGHSSGSVNAINTCSLNKDVKKLVLMDPVDNSFMFDKLRGKPLKLKNIEKLLFLNAARSYEWNLSPTEFSAPFIPSFEIKPENLQLKKGEHQTIEASAFGHSDVLDKTWADIMHNTISKGSEDRDENVLNEYKLWLGTIIKNFITDEEYEETVKSTEDHVEEAMQELNKYYKEVTDNLKISAAKMINSRKQRSVNNTSILYRRV